MKKAIFPLCILINMLFVNCSSYAEAVRFIALPSFWFATKQNQLDYPKIVPKFANNSDFRTIKNDWALSSMGFFDVPKNDICNQPVRVAIVDTGIDYNHPDLRNLMWKNQGESGPWIPSKEDISKGTCRDKSCNGIDDDGNGFIDDVVGWDFVHDVPLPYDQHGHGTHIAGIIASTASAGSASSCQRIEIMALKYYDSTGGLNNLTNTVRAIKYATKQGAQIINYSGGGSDPAASEKAAIEEANRQGIIFISAAGNDGHSNDSIPYYPASYNIGNSIGVASLGKNEMLLPYSNFGRNVHLAAPGLSILSTLPEGKYGTMSGTSQSTAFVTGLIALLQSQGFARSDKYRYWALSGAKPLKGNDKHQVLSNGIASIPGALSFKIHDLQANIPKKNKHDIGKQ